jgi:hypothetical protein
MKKKVSKRILHICIILSLIIVPITLPVKASSGNDLVVLYETKEGKTVTSGLTYEKKSKLTNKGWVDIYVLKMELDNDDVDLDIIRSIKDWSKKNTLTNIMDENDSVGGINASFFDTSRNPSDIIGIEYEKDISYIQESYNKKTLGASSMKVTSDNQVDFGYISGNISLKTSRGVTVYIGSVNGTSDFVNSNIYNRNSMEDTSQIENKANLYKIVVEDGVVIETEKPKVAVTIPEDGYVVTINEKIAEKVMPSFSVGTEVDLKVNTNLGDKLDLYDLVLSGGGTILKDGQVVEEGLIIAPSRRHPRTAVGVTKDNDYLIAMVVDGRGSSIGATHKEMGEYLLEYDVNNAIHMDGGGSSTLASRELGTENIAVDNIPSDGNQRKIVNGLGFISTAPRGELSNIEIKGSTDRVFEDMPITYKVIGYDEYYNPVDIDMSQISWSTKNIKGTWEDSTFTPTSSGEGSVVAYYDGVSGETELTVMEDLIDLEVEPKVLSLNEGDTGVFKIKGTDIHGYKGDINTENVTWEIDKPELGYFNDGEFIAGSQSGIGNITIISGDIKLKAYVIVGSKEQTKTITSFEDAQVTTLTYPDEVIGEAYVSDNMSIDGDESIELNYDLQSSDVTQAVYAVLDNIEIADSSTKSLGLNVYGNDNSMILKGKIVDAKDETYTITFSNNIDFTGWKNLKVDMPKGMEYPVKLERIYLASLHTQSPMNGSIYFDLLTAITTMEGPKANIRFDVNVPLNDPMYLSNGSKYDFKASVVGSTKGKNNLLDNIVLKKVIDKMNDSDLSIFAGYSDISNPDEFKNSIVWNNQYKSYSYDNMKVITLGTGSGGIIDTNYLQWNQLQNDLRNTSQDNIVIIGNKSPINKGEFNDKREGSLLHTILSNFQSISGKNIYYINASGYNFNVNYYEGIRYIDINGLWYNIKGNKVDLNNTFYMLNFYLVDNELYYSYENIYPLVEVN